MENRNIAILLARLDSQRLPKKHFEMIGDDTLINHCLKRLKPAKNFTIVLATSDREIDNPLADWAEEMGIEVYRGDAHDIRKRIKGCLLTFRAERFARVNADSPFIDATLIDSAFELSENTNSDLVTNLHPRTYPYGYSIEVFNAKTFIDTIDQNKELENVTTYFYQHADKFKIENLSLDTDHSKIALTVDTREDLEKMRYLYSINDQLFNLPLEQLIQLLKNNKNQYHD